MDESDTHLGPMEETIEPIDPSSTDQENAAPGPVLSTTGYLGYVAPMGEDITPNNGNLIADSDPVPAWGEVAPYSQARVDSAKAELKKVIAEVGELYPIREGPLTLDQISRWADRNITQAAREHRPGQNIIDTWIDPENLQNARNGQGTEFHSKVYRKLGHIRVGTKTEEAQVKSNRPTAPTSDDSDSDSTLDHSWKRKWVGTTEFHGQWAAYQASPCLFPQVKDGVLFLESSPNECTYRHDHKSILSKVQNPAKYEQTEFELNWDYWPQDHWSPQSYRARFFSWLDAIPDPGMAIDIYHAAFFDGTACPDGGSSMMIMKDRHAPVWRNSKDEQNRLHWHETSAGYTWNIRTQMKTKIMIEIRESQKQMTLRGTLGLPSKRIHPYLILRPGEFTDVDNLVSLFNWYAENTTFLPETAPITKIEVHKMIHLCRTRKLPFIVAVPEITTEVFEKRPDDPEIAGVAYVKRFNDERSTGEVRVLVHPKCKQLQIGTALVDMIMRSCDTQQSPTGYRPYKFQGRENLAYGADYPCNLTHLVCSIAYEPSKLKRYAWIKTWLSRTFQFNHLGHVRDGRVKFGHK